MAERVLPEASLWSLLQASENRGRPDLAQFYYGELMHLLMQKNMMRAQSMMPQGPAAGQNGAQGGAQGGPPTANPMVMPNAMMGVPPPTPTPQAGPNVPPGSPRPGAQDVNERLRRLGLTGPTE